MCDAATASWLQEQPGGPLTKASNRNPQVELWPDATPPTPSVWWSRAAARSGRADLCRPERRADARLSRAAGIFSGCWSSRRCTTSRMCSCSHRVIRKATAVSEKSNLEARKWPPSDRVWGRSPPWRPPLSLSPQRGPPPGAGEQSWSWMRSRCRSSCDNLKTSSMGWRF
jgi:hypothetical protein